jgi:dihydrolipoamide dehydrogenase
MQSFDVVVIGSGPGGYVCAIRAAQLGLKTAIIEKEKTLGGTCLNIGCIPSKAMLESSELYSVLNHKLTDHGLAVTGVSLDLAQMLSRKERIVKELTDGVKLLMQKNKITVFKGAGRFTGPNTIAVDGDKPEELTAKNTVIATGSVPVELPFLKFDGETVVDSTGALSFPKVPESMVVVGGGAIGLEMASVWARLGAKVTVVEVVERIAAFADAQMSKTLQKAMEDQGITFKLGHKVKGAEVAGGRAKVSVEKPDGTIETLDVEKVLVAVGRKAFTGGLGLEAAGVETSKGGKVKIDLHFATNVPGIYAIGDVVHGPMLAHKAEDEGVACAENIAGKAGHVNYGAIPNIIYTWPELATVGLGEEELKDEGIEYAVGKYYFKPNGRAKAMNESEGLVKVIADKKTDRLLGVQIVGPRAAELIAEAVTLFEFGATAEDMARICHAHPTLSEVMKEAAMAVDKRAIHG